MIWYYVEMNPVKAYGVRAVRGNVDAGGAGAGGALGLAQSGLSGLVG